MVKKLLCVLALVLMAGTAYGDSTKFDNIRKNVVEVTPSTTYGYYGYHVFASEGGIFHIDPSDVTTSTMDTWLGPADGVGVTVFVHPRSGVYSGPEARDVGEEITIVNTSGTTDMVVCAFDMTTGVTAWNSTKAATDPSYATLNATSTTITNDSPSGVTDNATLDGLGDNIVLGLGDSAVSYYFRNVQNN